MRLQVINFDSPRGGISLVTEKGILTTSRLLVQKAVQTDSGLYTCTPSNANPTSVRVHIVDGKYSKGGLDNLLMGNNSKGLQANRSNRISFEGREDFSTLKLIFARLYCRSFNNLTINYDYCSARLPSYKSLIIIVDYRKFRNRDLSRIESVRFTPSIRYSVFGINDVRCNIQQPCRI